MAEASALRRTVREQSQQTEQDRTGKADQRWISRAEQNRPQQAGSRQTSSRADRSGNGTEPRGGGMVLDPRGYESCQGLPALRIGSENSFTVPIQFPLRSNFLHQLPGNSEWGRREITLWLCGRFLHVHLLSADHETTPPVFIWDESTECSPPPCWPTEPF